MANRLARRFRPIAVAVASLGAAALVLPTVAGAAPHTTPNQAKPTVQSVQQQLSQLAEKNSQLVDKYDHAQSEVSAAQKAAARAATHAAAAQRHLNRARSQLGASAAAEYEGGSFSETGALLSSASGSSYLDQLDTLSMLSSHSAQIVRVFSGAQKAEKSAQNNAEGLLRGAKAKRDALAKQKTAIQTQVRKYTVLLASLNAAQRLAFHQRINPTVSNSQVSLAESMLTAGAARTAVQFALNQVGKPYVWGAAGPSSYDCSGLTMASYRAAGISLPHSAADQYNYGHHVSFNSLKPGDLMFFYQPIGHVTIYIGNGMMVSAPQTGENVKVVPADNFGSSFTGATRLVG